MLKICSGFPKSSLKLIVDYDVRQYPLKTQEEQNLTAECKHSQIPAAVQQTHEVTMVWVVPVASNGQGMQSASWAALMSRRPVGQALEWAMTLA